MFHKRMNLFAGLTACFLAVASNAAMACTVATGPDLRWLPHTTHAYYGTIVAVTPSCVEDCVAGEIAEVLYDVRVTETFAGTEWEMISVLSWSQVPVQSSLLIGNTVVVAGVPHQEVLDGLHDGWPGHYYFSGRVGEVPRGESHWIRPAVGGCGGWLMLNYGIEGLVPAMREIFADGAANEALSAHYAEVLRINGSGIVF